MWNLWYQACDVFTWLKLKVYTKFVMKIESAKFAFYTLTYNYMWAH